MGVPTVLPPAPRPPVFDISQLSPLTLLALVSLRPNPFRGEEV